MNERKDRGIVERVDGWTDRQTDINTDKKANEWKEGLKDWWMDR